MEERVLVWRFIKIGLIVVRHGQTRTSTDEHGRARTRSLDNSRGRLCHSGSTQSFFSSQEITHPFYSPLNRGFILFDVVTEAAGEFFYGVYAAAFGEPGG